MESEPAPLWSGKRHRTAFTNRQLEFLKNAYECNNYPAPSEYTQLGADSGLSASVVRTWFCNTRASKRKQLRPMLQMDAQDKEFFNYLGSNQPQILPFFRMVPWQLKNQPSSHQRIELNTCPTNQSKDRSQETKTDHNVRPSTSLNPNVVQSYCGSLGEHTQQPVPPPPTTSNSAIVQRQQFGNGGSLHLLQQSTGGAYHALCDAIGIDRLDPQISMLSAEPPGNPPLNSNGTGRITAARVQSYQPGMTPYVNNGVFLTQSGAGHSEDTWIANAQPTVYCAPVSHSDRFIDGPNEQRRRNLSKFPDDYRCNVNNGQNGLSYQRWSQATQYLKNSNELLHVASNVTDNSGDYLLPSNNNVYY